MTRAPSADPNPVANPPRLPDWLRGLPGETLEDAALSAGAALALLHQVQSRSEVPLALWRARLALQAAAQTARHAGRPEREAAIRDALCLLRPGDAPGPAGEIGLAWQRAVERPLSAETLARALPQLEDGQGAPLRGGPIQQAAAAIEAALAEAPRDHLAALILGDAALARALGWTHLIPLLGLGLTRRDLGAGGGDLRLACHRAVLKAAGPALQLAADLARQAARLQSIAPKLRTKQSDRAVQLVLTCDAVAPAMLTGLMSDRAARRFCYRLVELGAARELTGRETFRLYGL
ncbi:DUF1403 family protein [Paracoccus zhejiangensis]|uniref:DUF1403 domain-containing protein n=1 Tax=Paracoccus zhejiangensis TaxID=1077935 RepID=A0A2H5F4T5_9RHOB|nr:DUF1403 family protein [Paracoccus zhejiangensis]AUH66553.1 hypothetical protein CX676_19790 [Paracoccus zhejiangensis]